MTDWNKQIEHWRTGALEDFEAAEILLEKKKRREALFFVHLSWRRR
jgi:HEPN domain-containing protein